MKYALITIVFLFTLALFAQDEPDTTKAPFGHLYAISVNHKGHIYSDCRYIEHKTTKLIVSDSLQVCKSCANQLFREESK